MRGSAQAAKVLRSLKRGTDPVLDLVDPARKRWYPRDPDATDGYTERFPDTARVFDRFLKRSSAIPNGRGEAVAVVVMPWFGTPVPWFTIAIGLGLAGRGRSVTFVWHDLDFPEPSPALEAQHDEIRRVMAKLGRRFPVLQLSEQPAAPDDRANDDELVDRLADANLTWMLRGAPPDGKNLRLRQRMRESLAAALPRVRTLIADHQFVYALVPGGVVGPSGLYLDVGRRADVRVASFDAGLGATAIDTAGGAAQHTDAPRAFEMLEAELRGQQARHDEVVRAARDEYERRRAGLDNDRYQAALPDEGARVPQGSILIPLSVVFDSAALGQHHLFADAAEWLVTTTRVLLDHTRDQIVIRQHPSERRSGERSEFDAGGILREAFGSEPQVTFIAAGNNVSTYDLLDASRLVLPFVSTIGIEAAALGKPVVISGTAYYADLGFVWAPRSKEEYVDLLERGAKDDLPLLPDQVDRAWRCYYLTAVCQRVWTNFTAQPPDFWRWVAREPDELYRDPDVEDILTSIDDDVPLSIVRHARRNGQPWRQGAKP